MVDVVHKERRAGPLDGTGKPVHGWSIGECGDFDAESAGRLVRERGERRPPPERR
jgi:hypothetical protein